MGQEVFLNYRITDSVALRVFLGEGITVTVDGELRAFGRERGIAYAGYRGGNSNGR